MSEIIKRIGLEDIFVQDIDTTYDNLETLMGQSQELTPNYSITFGRKYNEIWIQRDSIEESLIRKAKDFAKKLAPVYQLLNWKWGVNVPSETEIEKEVIRLIRGHTFAIGYINSCGGITIETDEDGSYITFSLQEAVYS